MRNSILRFPAIALLLALFAAPYTHAQFSLLAVGALNKSSAGNYTDLSGLHYKLENGVSASDLGGFGSAIAYAGNNTFLALPDRGPNAVSYDSGLDDTASYINRFHTVSMSLQPNTTGKGRPFTLTPTLNKTTLLWSPTALVYGAGDSYRGFRSSAAQRCHAFLLHRALRQFRCCAKFRQSQRCAVRYRRLAHFE